ncbi:TfoX domain protein [Lactobacillus pentosus] [Lactiplantibacillus mudanjiangensis]|uniref:TfoX/Sxy family protein n=1 Tax=Lactiplantibacillus mudanjiangensis TaxID=1296538 RepID=UPI001013E654|nr:TfoX/Sxy family protein [Lactiplantibacillus mudanjiangensis]VDG30838.1 TfoX domain protein [Lactobacillus pentosus] [Lactiplantibacillus mudanjiangensis]
MKDLMALPNIGKVLAQKLIQAGIETPQDLAQQGSQAAFAAIKAQDPTACIQLLYSLEGAIENCPYQKLPADKKQILKAYFKACAVLGA